MAWPARSRQKAAGIETSPITGADSTSSTPTGMWFAPDFKRSLPLSMERVILVSRTGPSSFGNLPMVYRGVKYAIVKDIDVHPCWRWTFDVNDRRFVGQTKISSRAAEIQARRAIDKALGPKRAIRFPAP